MSNQADWTTLAALLLLVAAAIVLPVVGLVLGSPALLAAMPVAAAVALVVGLIGSRFNLSVFVLAPRDRGPLDKVIQSSQKAWRRLLKKRV